ncbi:MAG: hypothetical protein JWP87_2740, partial [Labilithrix sp.]|nr:hypothetical protein [Labilithrix sp.]
MLWGFPAILLMTFCSLSDLDYLRSEIGAADIDADIDAESGARDAIVESELAAPPCGADGGYRELVLCDQPAAYWRLGDLGPPSAINQADSGSAAAY